MLRSIVLCACCFAFLAAAAQAPAADVDRPVVSQGGVTVTTKDVDAYMQRLPADKWAGFVSNAERIESMLKDLLRTKQLAQEARDMKLDRTDSAKGQLALAQEDVLAKLRFKAFADSIKVPDLTLLAKEEYLSHKDQYAIPADVTVQHVLIDTKARNDADAQKLAETVHAQALANPEKFEDLVLKYSDDPSKASNKGVMTNATSKKYVKEFAEAAANLDAKNLISPVVKTRFGYHILKFISATPAKQKTFDEVKGDIVEHLRAQYIDNQKQEFLAKLASQDMKPYPDVIASLHDRYFTGTGSPVEKPLPQPSQPSPVSAPGH